MNGRLQRRGSGVNRVVLKKGLERSALKGHPWIYSGAVKEVTGSPGPGETVQVVSHRGKPVALGAYSPDSQIRVRLWSTDPEARIGRPFFEERIKKALSLRRGLISPEGTDAYRLVNAESDGLPGLVVDRYGGWLVCQFLSAGAERWKSQIVDVLQDLLRPHGIWERSDQEIRRKEGLEPVQGLLLGRTPPDIVEIREGPARFLVDVKEGHKTGFYLDQRENRWRLASLAQGAECLNAFSYTGGFGIAALLGKAASVLSIDTSRRCLELGEENLRLNNLPEDAWESWDMDAFAALRRLRDMGRSFDIVVLDPPKFVESKAQLERGLRGYKDINLFGLRLLRPGGLLFTFSCSAHVTPERFNTMIGSALLDSGREARIVARLGQAPDHPASPLFPEGLYLKGLILRAL